MNVQKCVSEPAGSKLTDKHESHSVYYERNDGKQQYHFDYFFHIPTADLEIYSGEFFAKVHTSSYTKKTNFTALNCQFHDSDFACEVFVKSRF